MGSVARMLGGTQANTVPMRAQEVCAHLRALLATRAGQSPAAPSYGVAGGAERLRTLLQRWPLSQSEIQAALKQPIVAHEPRLSQLCWAAQPQLNASGLTLTLAAALAPDGTSLRLVLCVDPQGHVTVVLT